ncbi:MAG: hypothetical protein ABH986_06360 [archaeon]
MSKNIIAYSFSLNKISNILKSQKKDCGEEIFFVLSRGLIKNKKLKNEIIRRLNKCIFNGILNLEKFWEYLYSVGPLEELNSMQFHEQIKFLEDNENTVGILADKKWADVAKKEFEKEDLKYTIFNPWRSSESREREAYNILYEELKKEGCEYYHSVIRETDTNKIMKKAVKEFHIDNTNGNWLTNINKINDFNKFSKNTKKELAKKIQNIEWIPRQENKKILEPVKLIKNALKCKEDTIHEMLE